VSGAGGNGAKDDVVLRATGVSKVFGGGRTLLGKERPAVRAVTDVSIDVRRGRTLGLVGESGCGKSTLGKLLTGLLDPTAGTIEVGGRALSSLPRRELHRQVQLVFQDPTSSLNPRKTVRRILSGPLEALGIGDAAARAKKVDEVMALCGLRAEFAERYPHEFSGGQRQRIGVARALVVEPSLVVLDESTSALDVSVQAQILQLLKDLQARLDLAYVFVSHDLSVVESLCDDVAVMYLGRVVERGTREELFGAPKHPYTRALLSAVPVPGRRGRRIPLEGEPPSPLAPPPGCPFAPRCYRAEPRCTDEVPGLDAGEVDHPTACFFADDSEPPAADAPATAEA